MNEAVMSNDNYNGLDTKPWYRQFWPWFLIALPATTVVAGISMIFISLHDPDGLVVDEYYKHGKAINQQKAKDERATELNARVFMRVTPAGGPVEITLEKDAELPAMLSLAMVHPTRPTHDQRISLAGSNGVYRGELQAMPPANWRVMVESEEQGWRLSGRLQMPGPGVVRLEPLAN